MKKQDQISFASNRLAIQKFKVVLVGDQNAGKSSILIRYIKNEFDKTNNPTIGIDFTSKNVTIGSKTIRLQLWDTAGQERFRSLIPSYLKDCNIAMIVFDITNELAGDGISKWIDFIRESRGSDAIIYVVGNKKDLQANKNADSVQRIKQIAQQQHLPYHQVSAKTGEGIQELYGIIIDKLIGSSTVGSTGTPGSSISDNSKSQKGPTTVTLKKPSGSGNDQPAQQRACC